MSRIVLLTGSPRRAGNSRRMADSFQAAAERLGHSVVRFDAAELKISGCWACNCCYRDGRACALDDGYNEIAAEFDKADAIVIATPVYWYSYPAQLKNIMDHWYSLCFAGRSFAGKKAALIACCEDDDIEAFSGMRMSFRTSMELLEAEVVGEVLIQNVHRLGDIENTDGLARAAELAELL